MQGWSHRRSLRARFEIEKAALPDIVEDWKLRGVPTWYCDGMICTGETYKTTVKTTFARGAALDDPRKS